MARLPMYSDWILCTCEVICCFLFQQYCFSCVTHHNDLIVYKGAQLQTKHILCTTYKICLFSSAESASLNTMGPMGPETVRVRMCVCDTDRKQWDSDKNTPLWVQEWSAGWCGNKACYDWTQSIPIGEAWDIFHDDSLENYTVSRSFTSP